MPTNHIQLRWSSFSSADYSATLDVLKQQEGLVSIKSSLGIKGSLPPDSMKKIIAIAMEHEAEVKVLVHAQVDSEYQMRLFGAPSQMPLREGLTEEDLDKINRDLEDFGLGPNRKHHPGCEEAEGCRCGCWCHVPA